MRIFVFLFILSILLTSCENAPPKEEFPPTKYPETPAMGAWENPA